MSNKNDSSVGRALGSSERSFDWKSFDMDKFFKDTDAAGKILKKNRGTAD